jgi:hypothetical protein
MQNTMRHRQPFCPGRMLQYKWHIGPEGLGNVRRQCKPGLSRRTEPATRIPGGVDRDIKDILCQLYQRGQRRLGADTKPVGRHATHYDEHSHNQAYGFFHACGCLASYASTTI